MRKVDVGRECGSPGLADRRTFITAGVPLVAGILGAPSVLQAGSVAQQNSNLLSSQWARVTIGTDGDFPLLPGDGGDWAQPVNRALSATPDNHRWLVFTDALYDFYSTVNLDGHQSGSPFLRLEGGGVGVTRIRRMFNGVGGAPSWGLFSSSSWNPQSSHYWHLFVTGLEFDGNRSQFVGSGCQFGPLDFSYFENCGFNNCAGDGGSFGVVMDDAHQVSTIRFVNCQFVNNAGNGVSIRRGVDVQFLGGVSRDNGDAGVYLQAKQNRGCGFMAGMHVVGGPYGVYLEKAHAFRIMNCTFENSVILFDATVKCMVQNNVLLNTSFVGWSDVQTVSEMNYP